MKFTIAFGLAFALASNSALAASQYTIVKLVSDQAGVAQNTDPDLVNPWGISHSPSGPNWISDNGTNKSTVYSRTTGSKSLSVNIPVDAPTGTAYVPSGTGFPITEGSKTGDSGFLFDTESGFILGWSASVDPANAVVAVDNSGSGAAYKGMALEKSKLYVADFANNQVQIYDNTFKLIGNFTDETLPKHFAPFNVAAINGNLYVSFAKRKKASIDEVDKKGFGYVDVFDTSGNLLQHLIANGKLDAPWGMAIAPAGFGDFSGALLVGNFGNGKINAYDASTGDFLGMLKGTDGKSLKIEGLWGLDAGPGSDVTFTAGPNDESHGLLGLIELSMH